MIEQYYYVTEVYKMSTGYAGSCDTEEMEKRLKAKGLHPFGYLRGERKGVKINRAFYSVKQVEDFLKISPPPKSDAQKIADLEKKVNDLLKKLGEKWSSQQ